MHLLVAEPVRLAQRCCVLLSSHCFPHCLRIDLRIASASPPQAAGLAKALLVDLGLTAADVTAIGVGMPGSVDGENGVLNSAANFDWKSVPLAQDVSGLVGACAYIFSS